MKTNDCAVLRARRWGSSRRRSRSWCSSTPPLSSPERLKSLRRLGWGSSRAPTLYFDSRTTKSGLGGASPDVMAYSELPNSVDALVLHSGRDSARMRSRSAECRLALVSTSTLRSRSSSRS